MQNITRVALGLGAAALVASGGSAFTASSDIQEQGDRLGYGSHLTTGVNVNNIDYVSGASIEHVARIRYSVTNGPISNTSNIALLTINSATTSPSNPTIECAIVTADNIISCELPANTTANSISGLHLVVKPRTT